MMCLVALLTVATDCLSAQTIEIVEHLIPTADTFPDGIVTGPDGALWFTEYGAGKIGRLPPGSNITEYPVPTPDSAPYGITVGPDGALWFTEYFVGKIGRITLEGAVIEYDVPTPNSFPAQIATGPDGALWFTEFTGQKIGRITTQGAFTEYNLAADSFPIGIAAGPDGALWFTESSSNKIGRITTQGAIQEYAVPTPFSQPVAITPGPDGALWFTEQSANKIGRITVAGGITEFAANGGPASITSGSHGTLWFTEYFGVKVGRITIAGQLTEFPVPTPGFLRGITEGPGGGIWFAENSADRIGQVVSETAALSASPASVFVGSSVTVTGAGFAAGESVRLADGIGPFRTATADSSGGFTLTARVRPGPFASNSFVAVGQASHRLAVADYFVRTSLFAAPAVVSAGDQVTVAGFGFNSHDSVDVYIDNRFFVGSTTADTYGSMAGQNSVQFTVPSRLPVGRHTVNALGSNGVNGVAELTVQ